MKHPSSICGILATIGLAVLMIPVVLVAWILNRYFELSDWVRA